MTGPCATRTADEYVASCGIIDERKQMRGRKAVLKASVTGNGAVRRIPLVDRPSCLLSFWRT
jgi:hypothetical protein